MLARLAALATIATSAYAAVVTFDLPIVNKQLSPDGFTRDTVSAGGTFPGTLIKVQKGDSVVIHLHNQLSSPNMRRSTSIHWHGFLQARTSGMDGPAFVNQCPIAPSTTFDYVFDTAGQTGNYWYHSHLSTQYCDGLRGSFIVYDPNDPLKDLYDVDDDSTVIQLAEWYHNVAPDIQNSFMKTGVIQIQDSVLINGAGRYNGGQLVPWSVITVKKGLRYRFRIFSLSCRPFMRLSFDNHTFDVIELDGVEHNPQPFQTVDVYAAERYSIVLNANQTVGNYWIRAPAIGGNAASNPNYNASLSLAILRYEGAPIQDPVTVNVPGRAYDDAFMSPIPEENPGRFGSGPPDIDIVLNISQPNAPLFDINGVSYQSPSLPVLLQLLSGAAKPTDFIPSENLFLLGKNQIIDISIPGTGAHPFHLHGHNFDIVLPSGQTTRNYATPARRDVVPVNGPNMTFRFFSDNPGAWFLHCHIDWHLEAGLAVVFGERPEENISGPQSQIQTAQWKNLCPTYDDLAPELQ